MRAPRKKPTRKIAPDIAARLGHRFSLQMQPDGNIAAFLGDYSVNLGQFSAAAMDRARHLSTGLPLASFAGKSVVAREIDALVHRLARQGLLEYRLSSSHNTQGFVVIEPQVPDYWPRRAKLGSRDTVVLSRFAYLRRRGNEMVLESPRAGALFRIGDPAIAATLAALSQPRKIGKLNQKIASSTVPLLELLLDSQILLKLGAKDGEGLRVNEGDGNLVLWDFHDLVFHTRSTEGRQANPVGAAFTYAGVVPPSPAVRPPWAGSKIDLRKLSWPEPNSHFPKLLRERHSTRDFDDKNPVTLGELAQFLDTTARVVSEWKSGPYFEGGPEVPYSTRPYPSAGSAYELELYLTVANCDGLAPGLYHYDAGSHALVAISASPTTPGATGGCPVRHGRARSAANPHHDRGAFWAGLLEIQLNRIFVDPEGCRQPDSDALPGGDRYGPRRLRHRQHQHRSVRENDGVGIAYRGPGRSIRARPRQDAGSPRLGKSAHAAGRSPYCRVGSSRSRSQSPITETASVVTTMVVAGASMIQGARVRYSRP